MSRKSWKRPAPWLFSCAKAATKRSRSPAVSAFAFFRTRTITFTEPTSVFPFFASIVTSSSSLLGDPNLPAAKNGTEEPLAGTETVMLLVKLAPPLFRRTTLPPPVADLPFIRMLTFAVVIPHGSVPRIRHGPGAQVRNRAFALALLLICSSTFTVLLQSAGYPPRTTTLHA